MDYPEVSRRAIGVTFSNGHASVLVWAPFAKRVVLHNESTGDSLSMEQEDHGYWKLDTAGIKNADLYRFSIGDGGRLPDPASVSQPQGIHAASQAIDLSKFLWTDDYWRNPDFGSYIIYELHTGTFTEAGNFDGIVQQLDYLVQLGITAIELMPVAQFPGRRNWGYDGVFPFAVQNSYGGAKGLMQLVNECHRKGIAVILDVVYNHLGPEGNYLEAYGPYFTDKYKTPWGNAINFDDAYCDPVRRFFIENALMWLRDFHIDALRMDAVHAIKDNSPRHIVDELNEAVARYNAATGSDKYLILETDLNDSRFIKPKEADGYGVRAQWCDEFHHALRVATGQERQGYYADFNGLPELAKAMRDGYVYTGQYSRHRHRYFGTATSGISGDHFVVFDQNHDQVGNRMLGERLSVLVSFGQQKIMAAAVLLSPFVPLLFMGEEWGATTPFLYFTDHSDKELIEAVNNGRKDEFAAFQKSGLPPSPDDEATFLKSRLNREELRNLPHSTLYNYYRYLIWLRKQMPALTNYERESVNVFYDENKGVIITERTFKEQHVYCIFNFSQQAHEAHLQYNVQALNVVLCSSDRRWGGAQDCVLRSDHQSVIKIESHSVILLANYHVPASDNLPDTVQ